MKVLITMMLALALAACGGGGDACVNPDGPTETPDHHKKSPPKPVPLPDPVASAPTC